MGAFTQGLNLGFSVGMYNGLFGCGYGFGAMPFGVPFGCCRPPMLYMTPFAGFNNFYSYPMPMVNAGFPGFCMFA